MLGHVSALNRAVDTCVCGGGADEPLLHFAAARRRAHEKRGRVEPSADSDLTLVQRRFKNREEEQFQENEWPRKPKREQKKPTAGGRRAARTLGLIPRPSVRRVGSEAGREPESRVRRWRPSIAQGALLGLRVRCQARASSELTFHDFDIDDSLIVPAPLLFLHFIAVWLGAAPSSRALRAI